MTTLRDWLDQFPETTRRTYRITIDQTTEVIGRPVETAAVEDVMRYIRWLEGQRPSTVRRKVATLSSYFGWLIRTGHRTDNPAAAVRLPKVDRRNSIKWLDQDEMLALVEAARDERERALAWILAHGCRLSEVVALDVDSVSGDVVRVHGKGGKSRDVVLEPEAVESVRAFVQGRKSGPLFLSRRMRRLSGRQVQDIVKGMGQRIGTKVHPHMLRHTFATGHVQAGTQLITLQRLLGHSSADTTGTYAHLDERDLREAVRAAPLRMRAERKRLHVLEGKRDRELSDSNLA